jgi:hypothetical protein
MEKLMHAGLVKRIGGKYMLTSLGKITFSMLTTIETAIKYYWKLKAIDSIFMSAHTTLPSKEYQRIIDTLMDNQEIKTVLFPNSNNNNSVRSQSLLFSTSTNK